jgi:hypothetical protein
MLPDVRRTGGMSKVRFPPVMHTHFLGGRDRVWEIEITEARRSSKRWLLVREHRKPKWSLMRQPGEARRGPESAPWLGRLASRC